MASINNQSEYWDLVSSSKTFSHPLKLDLLNSYVSKEASILDFGCGYGRTCDELYRNGYTHVTGVDSSHGMIRRGQKEYPHLNLIPLAGNELPFESDYFDLVLLFAVLTCIPTNQGQRSIVKDMHRVLKPKGILYISDYWLQPDERNTMRYEAFKEKYGIYGVFELPEGAIVRHHERDWMDGLLSDYSRLHLIDIDVVTMNGNHANGFQYIGRKQGA